MGSYSMKEARSKAAIGRAKKKRNKALWKDVAKNNMGGRDSVGTKRRIRSY